MRMLEGSKNSWERFGCSICNLTFDINGYMKEEVFGYHQEPL